MANKITLKDKVEFLLKNEGIVGLIRKTFFYLHKHERKIDDELNNY